MITPTKLASAVRDMRAPSISTVDIAGSPHSVMELIADPVRMAELGEEIDRVRLLDGAERPIVGTRFAGTNRHGKRHWTTICTVTDADPKRFAFDVHAPKPLGIPIARWQYDVEPLDDGQRARLTQTSWIKAPSWFFPFSVVITGITSRPDVNRRNMKVTLDRVRETVESS